MTTAWCTSCTRPILPPAQPIRVEGSHGRFCANCAVWEQRAQKAERTEREQRAAAERAAADAAIGRIAAERALTRPAGRRPERRSQQEINAAARERAMRLYRERHAVTRG